MRRRVVIGLLAAAALLLAGGATAAAQPVQLSLTVSPSAGTLSDEYVATVVIQVRGINGVERFWAPDFGDFQVTDSRTKRSTQWTYDPSHGQQVLNEEVRKFALRPKRAGKLKIGPAKIKLDGREYQSKGAVVVVSASGQLPQSQDPNADTPLDASQLPTAQPGQGPPADRAVERVFLHAVVDRSKIYAGEQVNVTWFLYTRDDILKFDPIVPKLDGFVSVKLYEPQRYFTYREELFGGRAWAVAMVSKQALFPTRAGKLVVPSLQADVTTLYTSFGSPQRLVAPALTLDVQELPPNAPAGFDPAYVGDFTVEATVDRDQVAAGESLLLALTIKGKGTTQRMKIPRLELDGFDVYPPRDFDEKVDTSTDVVRSQRRYEYLLTPTKGGRRQVGPIEIPYFDPAAGKYGLARAEAIPVAVIGDPAALAGGSAAAGAERILGRDIRPELAVPALASRAAARVGGSRWIWFAFGAPPLAYLLVIAGDKLRERLRRETPRARLRRARGRARKRLRVAELHIRGGRAGKFFGEIARVLNEHIEERVGEPVAAMTRDQLREFLARKGFPEETVDALSRELENCDFARFAPSASGPGEMRAALRRVRALLTAIERVRPRDVDETKEAA
jgi:hypothetical protein